MGDKQGESQRQLLAVREAERQHLSRELHDGPIQELYGIQLQLQLLHNQLADERTIVAIETIQSALQQVVHTLRTTVNALHPPLFHRLGLTGAIRSFIAQIEQKQTTLSIHCDYACDDQLLPQSLWLPIFRIVQEALNNIVRHAQAQTVFIICRFDQQRIHLEIQDDGCGFKVPDHWLDFACQGHWGLLGMAERVEAIGGHFQVASLPGAGTRLQVTVPLTSSAIGV